VFAYITGLSDPSKVKDTAQFVSKNMKIGDTISYLKWYLILEDIKSTDSLPVELFGENGKLFEARMKIYDLSSKTNQVYFSNPRLAIAKGEPFAIVDTLSTGKLMLRLDKFDGNEAEIAVKESKVDNFLTLKVYKFPFINLLWLGTIIMAVGLLVSMVRRIQLNKGSG
jgi:cytochrome c-type biogenesis protein CcmF